MNRGPDCLPRAPCGVLYSVPVERRQPGGCREVLSAWLNLGFVLPVEICETKPKHVMRSKEVHLLGQARVTLVAISERLHAAERWQAD